MRTLKPCGTVAAYHRHRRQGEEPCQACTKAASAASLQWQRSNPDRPRKRAHERALRRLGQEYPERLAELRAEEMNRDAS